MKMLGLIGGTSWVSTIEYYRLINQQVNSRLGGSQSARCIIHSFNHADIQALHAVQNWDGLLDMVGAACQHVHAGGAQAIVLCANTMHAVADRLQDRIDLPLIHIADATASEIRRAKLDTVALLGTRFTMELDFFKERLARQGITAIVPSNDDREFIHATIYNELTKGILLRDTRARYAEIITSLAKQGAEGIVLGCTEIPLLITQADSPVPVFDTTAIHAMAAVNFALS